MASAMVPTRPSRHQRLRPVAGVLAAAVLFIGAGCGNSPESGGTGKTPAKGEPIKVMTIAPVNTELPPYPNIHEAAKIYGKWINDRGGINGRPLEVILCDDRGDPNEAAHCGRKAADQGVVAVIGSFTFDASRLLPILEKEQIAWFGACCPLVEREYSSPVSFVTGSLLAISPGVVARMVDDSCKKPAIAILETPAKDFTISVIKGIFKYKGFDPNAAKYVSIPIKARDYSSQVAEAIDGTDCIYGGISDTNWAPFLTAMRSLGGTQRLYGLQGNLNGPIAEQFPDMTQNAIVVNAYPDIAEPRWGDYRSALEEYDAPDLDWNSLAGLGTWAAFKAFSVIAGDMPGELTNDTFMQAAKSAKKVDTGGMMPVLNFTTEWDGMGGKFPRIFNRVVTFDRIDSGKLHPTDDKPVDMTDALNSVDAGS